MTVICSTVVRIGRFGLVGMIPLPLTSATWLALTKHGGVGVVGSLEMLLIVFHAFRLLCVRSIEVIISSHLSFFCSAISSITLFPASMVVVVVCHDQVRLQVSQGFRCRDS